MKKGSKKILLTFDYELFLGSLSGTASKCLIEPTEAILKTLEKTNSKAIFFVDILYLHRLREIVNQYAVAQNDYDEVTAQIKAIATNGHYVYLHVHPHWLDATYLPELNQWDLSNINRYAIAQMELTEAYQALTNGYQCLQEILVTVKDAKPMEGYRAGGLFIQPFSLFERFLREHQMPYEFSVYPGFYSKTKDVAVDFKQLPQKRIYQFNDDCNVENTSGFFTEFTISEIALTGLNRLVNSLVFRYNRYRSDSKPFGDGKGANHIVSNNHKRIGLHKVMRETAAVELMNKWKNHTYLRYLNQNHLLHFLSHPKLVSLANLSALEAFLMDAKKHYYIITDFKSFEHS